MEKREKQFLCKFLPVPFFVNLLEINTLLKNPSVSGEKKHVAIRTPKHMN